MNVSASARSSSMAFVELLRRADVLAAIAEDLQLKEFADSLRRAIQQAGARAPEESARFVYRLLAQIPRMTELLEQRIARSRQQTKRLIHNYKQLKDRLKPATNERAHSTCVYAGAEASEDLANHLKRLYRLAERELTRLGALQDCRAEVEWCGQGIRAAVDAIEHGKAFPNIPYPMRQFRDRKRYQEWVGSLTALVENGASILPELRSKLAPVLERLKSQTATVTFGGRFNAGKSSLLNAALGRRLLPTKDLAETGASCYLSLGDKDEAMLVTQSGRQPITCETNALQAAISLRGGQRGTDRAARVDRLEIQLVDFPGGNEACWIDPPGMFDRPEMTERAWEAARVADVMVWILRSQQFLGEAEADAIAEFIGQRGPASVIFVENAFMSSDGVDPWDYHLQEIAPVNQGKLAHFTAALGLIAGQVPPLVVVSAEQVLQHGHSYGAGALRRLLGRLGGPDCPLIRRARLQWALREFSAATDLARRRWREIHEENCRRHSARAEEQNQRDRRRSAFESCVEDELDRFFAGFSTAAVAAGDSTAETIAPTLHRDNTYQDRLNSELKAQALLLSRALAARINEHAMTYSQSHLSNQAASKLDTLLSPQPVAITVAQNDVSSVSIGAAAAAGAAAGTIFFGVGALIGAAVGAVTAAAAAGKAAFEKDCAETKANIRAAASEPALKARDGKSRTKAFILQECLAKTAGNVGPPPDDLAEQLLADLLQHLEMHNRAVAMWLRREANL